MKSRLLLILALILVALPTTAAQAVEPDGALIRSAANANWTYRIVGGAPVRIMSCAPFNACEGRKDVASLAGYAQFPKDGAMLRTDDGAVYRFAGGAPLWVTSCGYAPCPPRSRSTWTRSRTPRTCARCRSTGPSSATPMTAGSTASRAARRCSCAATWARAA